jgi:hypothetical protein
VCTRAYFGGYRSGHGFARGHVACGHQLAMCVRVSVLLLCMKFCEVRVYAHIGAAAAMGRLVSMLLAGMEQAICVLLVGNTGAMRMRMSTGGVAKKNSREHHMIS